MAAGNRARQLKWVVLGVVVLGAVAAWLLYPRHTDREQIIGLIERGKHGLETKNVKEIMGCIAEDYGDSENVSRSDLFRMVMQWPRVDAKGTVAISDYALNVDKDTATGTFDVEFVLDGQGQRQRFPMHLTLTFRKYRQAWRRVWLIKSVDGYDTGKMIEGVGNGE